MRTIEYPYYQPSFPEFNIAQEAVVPYLDQDVNLVIAFQTAVGKTVLAECCFGFHLSQDEGCRVVYIAPYKSLGSEKFEAWSNDGQLSKFGVMLSMGDHVASPEDYDESRLAVVTSEAFDSRTRASRYEDWLKSMACVVYDECFTEDAEVVTNRGVMKIGEVIDRDDDLKVLSFNHQSGMAEFRKVVGRQRKLLHREWYSISYSSGNIRVTSNQLFWVDGRGYVAAKDLGKGDILYVNMEYNQVVRDGTKRDFRDVVRGWFNFFVGRRKTECPIEGTAVGGSERVGRVEVLSVKEIGQDPAKGCAKQWLRKGALSFFNFILSGVEGYLRFGSCGAKEGGDKTVAVSDNASDSVGGLAHGRWKSREEPNGYSYGGIFRSRERVVGGLAEAGMGSGLSQVSCGKVLGVDVFGGRERQISRDSGRVYDSRDGTEVSAKDGARLLHDVWGKVSTKKGTDFKKQVGGFVWGRWLLGKMESYVKKNTSILSTCCDLEVEWNNNFFVNGVLAHNSHLIGDDSRGAAVEASMMRFTAINPGARLVLLSAVMGNAMEVAKWLKALNGKQTKCITSDWRPREVKVSYHFVEKGDKVPFVVERLVETLRGKTLVFVHSKVVGAEIAKKLRGQGIRAAFHNASLSKQQRARIEEEFNNSMSGLNVLVSTSTLGAGVNMTGMLT